MTTLGGLQWLQEAELSKLPVLAERVVSSLIGSDPFCLWLRGDLGAGKTTLVGHILSVLGLDSNIPVTSPTYAYVNEYEIAGKLFAHMDLYRAPIGLEIEDLGIGVFERKFSGLFVEWPEKLTDDDAIAPTHKLAIETVANGLRRAYSFEKLPLP